LRSEVVERRRVGQSKLRPIKARRTATSRRYPLAADR
jgi:hypothetical protein